MSTCSRERIWRPLNGSFDMTARHDMVMVLPESIPTLVAFSTGNLTRVDNVFTSRTASQHVTICETRPEERPVRTDHFPIWTTMECDVARIKEPSRLNFHAVDWDAFRKTMLAALEQAGGPMQVKSVEDLRSLYNTVMSAINTAVTAHVPLSQPSPYQKMWWAPELKSLVVKKRRMQRRAHRWQVKRIRHPCVEEFRVFVIMYEKTFMRAKDGHWVTFLQEVDMHTVFKASRIVLSPASDYSRARIPAMRDSRNEGAPLAVDNQDKSQLFFEDFFIPPANLGTLNIPARPKYPKPAFKYTQVTNRQIDLAIRHLAPYKAPGPNGIPNVVYVKMREELVPLLGKLFRGSIRLSYVLPEWKVTRTVVIRKPGKTDYTRTKSHRPIALKDTMGKICMKVVASILQHEGDVKKLLPSNLYGSRQGRTATDALHITVAWIKDALRKRQCVTMTVLDIKSAFPSTDPRKLVHVLRMRGIPKMLTGWITSMLSGRSTMLSFDDYVSPPYEVLSGLDQGCPLSPVLFAYYTASLMEKLEGQRDKAALSYVDDINLLTAGYSFADANAKAEEVIDGAGGYDEWAKAHNARFEFDKTGCVQYAAPRSKAGRDKGLPLMIGGVQVVPQPNIRYLGVYLDDRLNGKAHTAKALANGLKRANALQRLGRVSRGMPAKFARLLYFSCVVPSYLYAADVFMKPFVGRHPSGRPKGSTGNANMLQKVHRQMALFISGAMRTTATDVACLHAGLPPLRVLVNLLCHRAAIRMVTLPGSHPLKRAVQKASRYVQRHRAPLHELMHAFNLQPDHYEEIGSYRPPLEGAPTLETVIHSSRDVAKHFDREHAARVRMYSDGSSHHGGVGAAAALLKAGGAPPHPSSVPW